LLAALRASAEGNPGKLREWVGDSLPPLRGDPRSVERLNEFFIYTEVLQIGTSNCRKPHLQESQPLRHRRFDFRKAAIGGVIADDADSCPDYLSLMRSATSGYLSTPLGEDVELSLRLA
jgi:hypothetical protein